MQRSIKSALAAAVLGLSALSAVQAANLSNTAPQKSWRSIGPAPPAVEAAIVTDLASHTVYVASLGGGVLKSTDGGKHFKAVNTGLDSLTIAAMAMVPDQPNVVYASTLSGVFKTIDGGAHWSGTEDVEGAVTLTLDPTNPNVIYAGLSPVGGIVKSTDGGDTWIDPSDGEFIPAVFSLAIDASNPSVLYAGTQGAGGFKSLDGGATWAALSVNATVVLIDPTDPNIVYAGTNGDGVYRSDNAGGSFARAGSPVVGVVQTLIKSGNDLLAGTSTQGVSVSRDRGATWVNTGVSPNTALILNLDSSGAIYVGTNFDGVFVHAAPVSSGELQKGWSRMAWQPLRECNCQNGHAIAVDPGNPRHVFFSTNDGGLLVTHNGGSTWEDGGVNGLLTRGPRGIGFDPKEPRRVYVGSFAGGGFYKSDDHGEHWQRRSFGSAGVYSTAVSVDPADESVYVATISGDGVWKSTDFGDTFVRIDRAPGAPPGVYLGLTGRGITVDPLHHRTVYAATSRGATAGVWRSTDGGKSWLQVDPTPAFSVTVDPTDSTVVYAATQAAGVLKSTDGGATFALKSAGLPAEVTTSRTGSLQVDPQNPSVLYVGTEGTGVFKSVDGAQTWASVNRGLEDPIRLVHVFGLAMDPYSPGTLYASTSSSVFKISANSR